MKDDPIQTWMESHDFRWSQGGYWVSDTLGAISNEYAAFFYAVMEREKKMSETRAAVTIRNFLVNSNNPKRDGYAIRVCDTYIEATETELATLNKGEEAEWV